MSYIPLEIQKARRLYRTIGSAAICAIYLSALVGVFLLPEVARWPAIAVAILAPPIIEILLPATYDEYGRARSAPWLPYLVGIGLVIFLASTAAIGPEWLKRGVAAVVAGMAIMTSCYLIQHWVFSVPHLAVRKLTIIGLILACAGLAAGIIIGPDLVRSIAMGIAAAFLTTLFPTLRDVMPNRWPRDIEAFYRDREDHAFYRAQETDDAFDRRGRGFPVDGGTALDPALAPLDRTFSQALWIVDHTLEGRDRDDEQSRRHPHTSPLLLSIAALDNFGFITSTEARKFAALATRPGPGAKLEEGRALLLSLNAYIVYARSRLRAHSLGAHSVAITQSN
ncbi:hypothetical protein ASG11_15225 [Sphingomonas sp. Leaf357]|uniref:hypothetical protein n=1 Tax=Sphingomonas sp. Leaf357 TaxID=1736350 RepID=UPI00070199F1|nr:hypothetical protein [Sphingomonas sp. Leaf357]KQS02133.1 hypothetical protein ASG11_15225 [Sphingomonas sp. Leaf357]